MTGVCTFFTSQLCPLAQTLPPQHCNTIQGKPSVLKIVPCGCVRPHTSECMCLLCTSRRSKPAPLWLRFHGVYLLCLSRSKPAQLRLKFHGVCLPCMSRSSKPAQLQLKFHGVCLLCMSRSSKPNVSAVYVQK